MIQIDAFIDRWSKSQGAETSHAQSFVNELCALLTLPKPDVAGHDYTFERRVKETHTGATRQRFIDLYKRDCFIWEAKQGSDKPKTDDSQLTLLAQQTGQIERGKRQTGHAVRGTGKWDKVMFAAKNQADGYARAVAKEDGWPPFLLICDVGHVIEVYADFSRQGQGYTQFPDAQSYRIYLEDLRDADVRERLRKIWQDPLTLNPALESAKVTREIADHLAKLGASFEGQGHESQTVARYLMRCLFTMFAEDVGLIPERSFTELLISLRGTPEDAAPLMEELWGKMDKGGFSAALRTKIVQFNGHLFKETTALPLANEQLSVLIEAAEADWRKVEPAIFGTLLERALDARNRHKLGAHFTPRAYVERLVIPTLIEPLREEWKDIEGAAQLELGEGNEAAALKLLTDFHDKLCHTRVLDPACGSGNFLYVALELMKRLEGEVLEMMEQLGNETLLTVSPRQFLGIELNPWASEVADLVLWIGYLQWHIRSFGEVKHAPILQDYETIENRDAVLEWAERTPRLDEAGQPVTRWDGATTIQHPVTGEEVPDPQARIQVYDYAKPKAAQWPAAEFIVGNPPFIGASRLRESLGDGYAEALWAAYPKMPQSADLVMFWWHKAAELTRLGGTQRFGFITTNSIRQTFNRRVLEPHLGDPKKPLSLRFAIPDHPWVDTLYGAAVRIAMTVGEAGSHEGELRTVKSESKTDDDVDGREVEFEKGVGKVFANLQIGADLGKVTELSSNEGLSSRGVMICGSGFLLSKERAEEFNSEVNRKVTLAFPYLNGRDVNQTSRGLWVIDAFPMSQKDLRDISPTAYQHIFDNVKPERDTNTLRERRENWHWFGRSNQEFRSSCLSLERYIITTETSKHRLFSFVHVGTRVDNKLVGIGLSSAEFISLLSSKHHRSWALRSGSWLGVGNDSVYAKTKCFDPFPFPVLTDAQRTHLASLGEELDAHRKRQQAAHPKLTLTQMYNVLEKVRAGTYDAGSKDKEIYEQGLIGILKDLHDQIDVAVADAYGWPADLSDEDILQRLVDLNQERAAEEARGLIRWLRPDYQNPKGKTEELAEAQDLALPTAATPKDAPPWPKTLPERLAATRKALETIGQGDATTIARRFKRANTKTVEQLLQSLTALGQASVDSDGVYSV